MSARQGQTNPLAGPRLLIPVYSRNGIVAWTIIDREDAKLVGSRRWNLDRDGYVVNGPGHIARLMLGLAKGDGLIADHINRDKLDNRRANLRVVTPAQSVQNLPSIPGSSSRFRGVRFRRRVGRQDRWCAQMCGRYLGSFTTEDEAADAARAWRIQHMPYSVD